MKKPKKEKCDGVPGWAWCITWGIMLVALIHSILQ